ncbi:MULTISPECIES: hypothetical protein [Gulosibacter]|uniref:hypothetical protein n=1 Tax=Gulosibacter TaxID=256818 RepID=UPI000F63F452|nr:MULTISPECIES: hypothetical protein [Gulosibacter]
MICANQHRWPDAGDVSALQPCIHSIILEPGTNAPPQFPTANSLACAIILCDSKVFLVNNSVQLVSTDRNHQHLSVQLPVQEQFEGLTFFDRVSLRMGVWLVLRTERRRVKEAHERETLLLRHRLQQEAESLQLERERKFAVPGLQRRIF